MSPMYVAPEKLEAIFAATDTESLEARLAAGELTPEAEAIARSELARRLDSPTPFAVSKLDNYANLQTRRLWLKRAGLGLAATAAVVSPIVLWRWRDSRAIWSGAYAVGANENADPGYFTRLEFRTVEPVLLQADDTVNTLFDPPIGIPNAAPWYAFQVAMAHVMATPVVDMEVTELPIDWSQPEQVFKRARPRVPVETLFMFWTDTQGAVNWPAAGQALAGEWLDVPYTHGWKQAVHIGDQKFELEATGHQTADGAVVPGSLSLSARAASGHTGVVLGVAPGHIFQSQKVVWAGTLPDGRTPAFYIQRILASGEIDHVFSVARRDKEYFANGVTADPDNPEFRFTSGVGESEAAEQALANTPGYYPDVALPDETVGARSETDVPIFESFSLYAPPEENPDGQRQERVQPVPSRIGEKIFTAHGKQYRLTAELVSTAERTDEVQPYYASQLPFGSYQGSGTMIVVTLEDDRRRQTLLVTSPAMDSGLYVTAHTTGLAGAWTLTIDYYPHYNNQMTFTWFAIDDPLRIVRRTTIVQGQGC